MRKVLGESLVCAYAKAAPIRPLGAPDEGLESSDDILCLCPNDHILLDHGGVGIGEDLSPDVSDGRLTVHPKHQINEDHLHYRREHYQANPRIDNTIEADRYSRSACAVTL
jgi:putative restriction endonuclease